MIGRRNKSHQFLVASAIVGSLAWHSAGFAQDTGGSASPPPAGPTAPSAANSVEGGSGTPEMVGGQAVTSNDIIVTATRTTQRLENVPATILAVTGKQLQTAGVVRFADLALVAPGVQISRSGTYTQPAIRGITTSFAGGGQETNVAVYIDGIYQSDQTGLNQDLSNIQGIEILKGPQGTLYGRNATGGAILITTRSPTDKFQVDANVSYAPRFNDKVGNLFVGGPIANGIKFSVAASWHKGDGYIKDINGFSKNVTLDSNVYTFKERDPITGLQTGPARASLQYSKYEHRNGNLVAPLLNWSVRPKLVLEPTDNLKITLGYVHTYVSENRSQAYIMSGNWPATNEASGFDSTGAVCAPDGAGGACDEHASLGTTGKFKTSLNFRPLAITKQDEFNGTVAWKLGDIGTLTSHTAYRHQTDINSYELDGTPRNPNQPTANGTTSFNSIGFNNRHTFTQQLDYSGQFGPLTLLAGAFYYQDKFQSETSYNVGPFATYPNLSFLNFRTKAWGVYVDETYNINDKLFITAGIRYNYDHKKLNNIQFAANGGESLTGGQATSDSACMSGGIVSTYDPLATIDPKTGLATCHFAKDKQVVGKAWTPHVVIRYNLSRGTNIYASWSRGFKAATINSGTPFNSLKPETVTAYEVGIKTARGGFRGEASAFYYNYKNNQISAYNGTTTVTSNSGGAHVYGLDLSLSYKVPDMPLNLHGSMEYLHARYTDYANAGNVTTTSGAPLSCTSAGCIYPALSGDAYGQNTTVIGNWTGRRLLRAPDWTATIGADYTIEGVFGGKLVPSITAQYSSRYAPQNASYFCQYHTAAAIPIAGIQAPGETVGQKYCNANTSHAGKGRFEENGWAQINAQINWTDASEHFTIGVFGNNINNVQYLMAYSQPGYGKNVLYNEPRTFGVRAGVKF
jgi:iron complex outermembrane receptor protein